MFAHIIPSFRTVSVYSSLAVKIVGCTIQISWRVKKYYSLNFSIDDYDDNILDPVEMLEPCPNDDAWTIPSVQMPLRMPCRIRAVAI